MFLNILHTSEHERTRGKITFGDLPEDGKPGKGDLPKYVSLYDTKVMHYLYVYMI
jgi:hypothetical protein